MRNPHPVTEGFGAIYHGVLAGFMILGVLFHLVAAWNHWKDS